jgi:hypothetical protein
MLLLRLRWSGNLKVERIGKPTATRTKAQGRERREGGAEQWKLFGGGVTATAQNCL